jgi:hypothetical protein
VGQRFISSALYELPIGRGRMLFRDSKHLDAFIGALQVGGILTLSGGTPVNVGGYADGGLRKTVHATGISPIPENQRVAQFWNIAAFDANHPSLRGSLQRDASPELNAPSIVRETQPRLARLFPPGRCGKMQLA